MSFVDPDLVGEIWPAAAPFDDSSKYGRIDFGPTGVFEARSLQTFKLVYTAGPYGIDDTGALRIVFRFSLDIGGLQTTDPAAKNYVSAKTGNGAKLTLTYNRSGHMRPRDRALTVFIADGFLSEGDTITVVFGDTSAGSPGMQLQTFCESAFEFKVLVDIYATGHFVPLPDTPTIRIIPGPPAHWRAILPTLRRTGEVFSLGLRADDDWGNPSCNETETLRIESNLPIENLPDQIIFPIGQRSLRIDNIVAQNEGIYRIRVYNDQNEHLVDANPIVVQNDSLNAYWGDLHGQTGETAAVDTAEEYFTFARDLAFLDVTSHQGNDFQIKNNFWAQLNQLTAEFDQKNRFVTFPGYEWSGNTCIGGDHNVFFRHEGRSIRRSSHALVEDQSDIDSDAPTLRELFTALADEDCVVYAHVGGRYANTAYAHDPRIETAMEIHSAWGTFEWLLTDGFSLGHRCGVVCNSDDHKCRPGASHPGAADFGTYGGLTCFLTSDLSRDSIFDCLRKRHHYGTTGNRLHLDTRVRFKTSANFYELDPNVYESSPKVVSEIMMGDIAQTNDGVVDLFVEAVAHTPIERVEVLNGNEVVETLRGYDSSELGNRFRIVWGGAKYRGRGRKVRWTGKMRLKNARIIRFERINAWNPEKLFEQRSDKEVVWDSITTGNFVGFDIWLDNVSNGQMVLETNYVGTTLSLDEIGLKDTIFEADGLERRLRVYRMPQINNVFEIRDTVPVVLKPKGDNPLWVRVTTDDGYNAWSSPIFVYKEK